MERAVLLGGRGHDELDGVRRAGDGRLGESTRLAEPTKVPRVREIRQEHHGAAGPGRVEPAADEHHVCFRDMSLGRLRLELDEHADAFEFIRRRWRRRCRTVDEHRVGFHGQGGRQTRVARLQNLVVLGNVDKGKAWLVKQRLQLRPQVRQRVFSLLKGDDVRVHRVQLTQVESESGVETLAETSQRLSELERWLVGAQVGVRGKHLDVHVVHRVKPLGEDRFAQVRHLGVLAQLHVARRHELVVQYERKPHGAHASLLVSE